MANRVWRMHFHDQIDLKGDVHRIFEHLSIKSEKLHTENQRVTKQLQNAVQKQMNLEKELKSANVKKNQLEADIEKKLTMWRQAQSLPVRMCTTATKIRTNSWYCCYVDQKHCIVIANVFLLVIAREKDHGVPMML